MNESRKLSPTSRWVSSERIAARVLEELGFKVLETHKKVFVNNIEVGEVDIIASDGNGQLWAVEVKAGRIDVSGVRQIYVNSILLNMKPMIICKGFADDSAKELADKLGVRIIQLSDVFLVEGEELEVIIREVVEDILVEYLEVFLGSIHNIKPEHLEILKAIVYTSSFNEAAERLGMDIHTFTKKLDELRVLGVIPRWAKRYGTIRRIAQVLIQRNNIMTALEEAQKLLETTKALTQSLQQLSQTISSIQRQLQKAIQQG